MPLLEALISGVARAIAGRVFNSFSSPKDAPARDNIEDAIADHVRFVSRWAERVDFYGLSKGKRTGRDTVALTLSIPRRFRRGRTVDKSVDEVALLRRRDHYLVLGDPGAGKTTTFKRLARRLLRSPSTEADRAQFPLLVRLGRLTADLPLEIFIADALGIGPLFVSTDSPNVVQVTTSALHQLARSLEESESLLLLDGLDEIRPELRRATEEMIEWLVENTDNIRILVSCRSGSYHRSLPHFETLELLPLTPDQVRKVAVRWASEPQAFLSALAGQPFADLAGRPLFLCQLIVLYNETRSIPEQPSDVVRAIVQLAIEDWDVKHKGQPRLSQYAHFTAAKKRDFLAALAFYLTYELRAQHFTPGGLERAYFAIHKRFRLPAGEATRVAEELEAHTGIFVSLGHSWFEFSHLSIQEYLTAYHLVRYPISDDFRRFLLDRPGPMAIAVALSSTPERWLARSLLNDSARTALRQFDRRSFFSRLVLEHPALVATEELGFVAIVLALTAPVTDEYTMAFLRNSEVALAMKMAIPYFSVREEGDGAVVEVLPDAAIDRSIVFGGAFHVSAAILQSLRKTRILDITGTNLTVVSTA